MPNRLTTVPARPVPALPRMVRRIVPLADAFMVVMLSRPKTGSLRNTWVTPATLWLSLVVVFGCAVAAVAVQRVGSTGVGASAMFATLVIIASGALSMTIVGIAQRCVRAS